MRERAENDLVVGTLTSTTFLFIVLVLLLGVILGDTGKHTLFLFNLCGFLLYIAVGSYKFISTEVNIDLLRTST